MGQRTNKQSVVKDIGHRTTLAMTINSKNKNQILITIICYETYWYKWNNVCVGVTSCIVAYFTTIFVEGMEFGI